MVLRASITAALLIGLTLASQPASSQTAPAKPSSAPHTTQSAAPSQKAGPQNGSANELVRSTVQNELNAIDTDHSHWMYRSDTRKNGTMETQEVVETSRANLTRLVARNGQPLTPDEQKQADENVQQFITDTGAQAKQRHDLDHDTRQIRDLVAMLPDALTYTYAGQQGSRTRLTFRPNPDFHPPSREARVFHATQGQMIIDTKQHRLVEFSGRLARAVKFGGGLLGNLDAGGTFDVRQQEVGPGYWEITLLRVNIKGKALFFKTIGMHQDETDSRFKRVPNALTMAQAKDLLMKERTSSENQQPGH